VRAPPQNPVLGRWPAGLIAGIALLASCSSPTPQRLYVLNATPPSAAGGNAATQLGREGGSGSSQPAARKDAVPTSVVGVTVTVPSYLDRREIVLRSGPNEVKAMDGGRWADDLSVIAARALSDDLAAQLPRRHVVALPAQQPVNEVLRVDFRSFDIDTDGTTLLAGRWALAEGGKEKASGPILRRGQVVEPGFDATAAALSQDLVAISSDIAVVMGGLPPRSAGTEPR
jgi:uncharacterized protein